MFEPRTALLAGATVVVAAGMFLAGARWERRRAHSPPDLVTESPHRDAQFPLSRVPGQRYLADANGTPFLVRGDAAWSLIADLSREEADVYLADRAARGFNAILVNLLEHRFARRAPANYYGHAPFLAPGDFSQPDDAYFEHAEWVIARAREHGILVLLTPAYLGWQGNEDGWWKDMQSAGANRLHEYGRFLGTRFGKYDNILWVNGGDFDPPDRNLVIAIARGIRETAPRQLQTVHLAPETPVTDFWQANDEWLDVITAYTYQDVCGSVRKALQDPRSRPVILLESFYENERGTTAWRTRSQAYEAILCGAAGEVFGNNPVWHFHHAGIYPAGGDWWQNLGSPGSVGQTYLANAFGELPWWNLAPGAGAALNEGAPADSPAVAARSADGSLAMVYLPAARPVRVDLGQMKRPLEAHWLDPATGLTTTIPDELLAKAGNARLDPPPGKSTAESDWLLVLRTRSSAAQSPAAPEGAGR